MKIAIMQPYLFPYIGYFQLIRAVDVFVIFDDVNYINRGWINRNRILLNGNEHLFTLPLEAVSQNKNINQIKIFNDEMSKGVLLGLIKQAYAEAAEFDNVYPVLFDILSNDERHLSKYIELSLRSIANYLGLDTKFICSSAIDKDNNLRGQNKILEICRELNADVYINPIGGKELYDKKRFLGKKVELLFLKTNEIKYKQLGNEFISNLSIIDVLMFNNKDKASQLLAGYELL